MSHLKLTGFSAQFQSLEDYIIKITYQIWEEKGLGKIRMWYSKQCPVFTPTSYSEDVEDVVKFTLQTLAMFPDRQLMGECVIGCQMKNEDTFYSSHRILSTMTHLGYGAYGEPTGNLVKTRVIADCVCRADQIVEEWMVSDNAAVVKCLGLDPESFGREQGRKLAEQGWNFDSKLRIQNWDTGKEDPPLNPASTEPMPTKVLKISETLKKVWQNADLDLLKDLYNRAAESNIPGGETCNGIDQITQFYVDWVASFQDVEYRCHHWIQTPCQEGKPVEIAVRWSVAATHSGYGHFGPPSGAPLALLAMSHFELRDGKVFRDYHLIDECAVWAQIEAYDMKNNQR